jgi:uncharacterized protein YgbK (DUF1537 family)
MSGPWLGAVADDITGACDLADAMCEQGQSAVVRFGPGDGVDQGDPMPPCECAVVAVQSRTAPILEAVAQSVDAARALLAAGCTTIYQKYCSTFDSTDRGNIGPVADALRRVVPGSAPALAVGTPATPRSQRTVYQGHLFVGQRLLSESSLRDHPLTPMRDSDLVAVLSRQTPDPVGLVPYRTGAGGGVDAIIEEIDAARAAGVGHLLLDALDDGDLDVAAIALHRLQAGGQSILVGGAAGLAAALARTRVADPSARRAPARAVTGVTSGRRLIVSGSCSVRTREQVAAFDGPRIELSALELDDDPTRTVAAVLAAAAEAFDRSSSPVLVSSSADPDTVRESEDQLGAGRPAALLESAAGAIAARAVETLGVRRLLVAGGETSGAVVQALGISTLRVGPAVEPGLCWMVPMAGPLALLLKSGNFGTPELFNTAWRVCS